MVTTPPYGLPKQENDMGMDDFKEWYAELVRIAAASDTQLTIRQNDWLDAFDEGKTPRAALYDKYPTASPQYSPDLYTKHIPENSRWVHTNGTVYTVCFLTNNFSTDYLRYPPTVVYQGPNGKRWSRLAADWDRSMTRIPDGWFRTFIKYLFNEG